MAMSPNYLPSCVCSIHIYVVLDVRYLKVNSWCNRFLFVNKLFQVLGTYSAS
jgi:hypothetical protein